MNTALQTVQTWYEAFGRKDRKGMHDILAADFKFRGPLMSFDSRDQFVEAMMNLPFCGSIENSRLIADNDRVANVFLMRMLEPKRAEIPMCEVFEVGGGKIRSSELFYDSKLFPAGTVS